MKLDAKDIIAFAGIIFIGIGTAMIHKPTAFIVIGALCYLTVMLPLIKR